MKIGGVQVTGPSEEVLVLPREPEPIVFRAVAVPDMEEFHKLCPEPKPTGKFVKGSTAARHPNTTVTERG